MTKTQLCTWLTIKEIILWLTCTGQEFNQNNYKIVSDSQPKTWIHAHDSTHGASTGFSTGIKFSQLDLRNLEALTFVAELLYDED
jgi:hypothetical protein